MLSPTIVLILMQFTQQLLLGKIWILDLTSICSGFFLKMELKSILSGDVEVGCLSTNTTHYCLQY